MVEKQRFTENNYVSIWIEDGIIHEVFRADCPHLELDEAVKVVDDRLRVSAGETMPIFVDMRNLIEVSSQARSYLASEKGIELISAGAFLIDNHLNKLVFNLWLRFNRPLVPCKFFTEKTAALEWLQKYRFLN